MNFSKSKWLAYTLFAGLIPIIARLAGQHVAIPLDERYVHSNVPANKRTRIFVSQKAEPTMNAVILFVSALTTIAGLAASIWLYLEIKKHRTRKKSRLKTTRPASAGPV